MFVLNSIKLSAAVHELSCPQAILPYLAMVKNPIIRSCDLDLWPVTLKINRVRAVVKIHVRAKFYQAACSGSWVIVLTDKKLRQKHYSPLATARTEVTETVGYSSTEVRRFRTAFWVARWLVRRCPHFSAVSEEFAPAAGTSAHKHINSARANRSHMLQPSRPSEPAKTENGQSCISDRFWHFAISGPWNK